MRLTQDIIRNLIKEALNAQEREDKINSITNMIPSSMATWIWNTYKDISGSREPQPCTCGSAAKLWRKATDEIRTFVRDNDR